jgi:RNA-directed DNA polymerase
MDDRYPCKNKGEFIENLRRVNQRAGVEQEIIDLIEAYARLRLDEDKEIRFFDNRIRINDRELQEFLLKNRHLDHRVLNFLASYFLEIKRRGLRCVYSPSHLAHLLKISIERLHWLADDKRGHYTCFPVKKRDGGVREIFAPKSCLKAVQRQILDDLLHRVRLNSHAEGFRKRRSILTNAKRHIGKNVVIKMDVKDFFPSIAFERVLGMFVSLGYPRQVALLLTKLVTHNGRLPIGAPTSPAISNIVCRRLDRRFSRLGEKAGFDYSRYADDITISSNNKGANRMIPFFKEIIREEGFEVNEAKMRILRSGGRQKVTGIVVNKKPNLDKKKVRKLRAVIHNCSHRDLRQEVKRWAENEKGLNNPRSYSLREFQSSLRGKLHFVRMINPEIGKRLIEQLDYKGISF